MTIAWACLIAAGLFEIGWPIGLKWAQEPGRIIIGVAVAVVSMTISGALLYFAQKEISLARPTRCGPGSGPPARSWWGCGSSATRRASGAGSAQRSSSAA